MVFLSFCVHAHNFQCSNELLWYFMGKLWFIVNKKRLNFYGNLLWTMVIFFFFYLYVFKKNQFFFCCYSFLYQRKGVLCTFLYMLRIQLSYVVKAVWYLQAISLWKFILFRFINLYELVYLNVWIHRLTITFF